MSEEVSTFRLYLTRLLYLGNFVFLGLSVWPELIKHTLHNTAAWDRVRGAAFSFWAASSALSGLGIRYPLKMLPLLLLQLVYKSIWLIAVYLPLSTEGAYGDQNNGTHAHDAPHDRAPYRWPFDGLRPAVRSRRNIRRGRDMRARVRRPDEVPILSRIPDEPGRSCRRGRPAGRLRRPWCSALARPCCAAGR